mmetsp:Transcript_11245/g.22853  ORF Transcript_11245/g.22853 Transcript_11245/m.22853 type:complete len:245 (+) Transcript_11245:303-1037(+)
MLRMQVLADGSAEARHLGRGVLCSALVLEVGRRRRVVGTGSGHGPAPGLLLPEAPLHLEPGGPAPDGQRPRIGLVVGARTRLGRQLPHVAPGAARRRGAEAVALEASLRLRLVGPRPRRTHGVLQRHAASEAVAGRRAVPADPLRVGRLVAPRGRRAMRDREGARQLPVEGDRGQRFDVREGLQVGGAFGACGIPRPAGACLHILGSDRILSGGLRSRCHGIARRAVDKHHVPRCTNGCIWGRA